MLKAKSENVSRFIEILDDFAAEQRRKPLGQRNMCPPETDPWLMIHCLIDTFLGMDWYVGLSVNGKQTNTVALNEILMKYNRQFKKAMKEVQKDRKAFS